MIFLVVSFLKRINQALDTFIQKQQKQLPPAIDVAATHVTEEEKVAEMVSQAMVEWYLNPAEPLTIPFTEPAPKPIPVPVKQAAAPKPKRSQEEVYAILDEGYLAGHTTYTQLIEYVRLQTGTGCGKNLITKWKATRQEAA
jgi:hypothetical protein